MNFQNLEYFLVVAEEKNVSRAADKIYHCPLHNFYVVKDPLILLDTLVSPS